MPTYGHELDLTWIVLLIIAATYGYFGWRRVSYGVGLLKLTRPNSAAAARMNLLHDTAAVTFASFPAVYSTLNLLNQELTSTNFWRAEISSGLLALRISSYLLLYHFIRITVRYRMLARELINVRLARGVPTEALFAYERGLEPHERELFVVRNVAWCASHQFVFYLSTVAALWLCTIEYRQSLVTLVANWCLFFIVDDWVVMTDYAIHFRASVLKSHSVRIGVFNLLLLVLIPASLVGTTHWVVSIALCLVLLYSYVMSLIARSYSEVLDSVTSSMRRRTKDLR